MRSCRDLGSQLRRVLLAQRLVEEVIEADPSRTREEEPEEAERVERLVKLDEVVEHAHLLQLHCQSGHDHVDDQRNGKGTGEEAHHDEQAAEELGPAGEGRVESRRGDAPLGEPLDEAVEVVDLPPARLEEEVADEESHEELRHPLRAGQAAQRFVDPCCQGHGVSSSGCSGLRPSATGDGGEAASSPRIQPSANQLEIARKAVSTAPGRSANASQTTPSGSPDLAIVSACASSSSIGACSTSKPFLQTAIDSWRGEGGPGGAPSSSACQSGCRSCPRSTTRSADTKGRRSCGSSFAPIARRCSAGAGSTFPSSTTLARAHSSAARSARSARPPSPDQERRKAGSSRPNSESDACLDGCARR